MQHVFSFILLTFLLLSCKSDIKLEEVIDGATSPTEETPSVPETTATLEINTPTNASISEVDGSYNVDLNNTGTSNDSTGNGAITYSCYYDQIIDNSVASPVNCSVLAGVSFSSSTGSFSWVPTLTQSGDYEFKIVATDGVLNAEVIFNIVVQDNVSYPFPDGNGTASSPFQINSLALLNEMANYPDKAFILTADIDMSGGYTAPVTFTGSLDGNHYELYDWTDASASNDLGLFQNLSGGSVSNLIIKNADLTGGSCTGAVAGNSSANASVENIYVVGTIVGSGSVGGIIGCTDTTTMTHVHYKGYITSTSNKLGGIAGEITDTQITKASILAFVYYGGFISYIGGAVGKCNASTSSTISEVYSLADIRSTLGGGIHRFSRWRNRRTT
ncbi:MAG: putative Ig domain-containing protein [Halobacteriovoraceae bacterium]|nr:putative Ig domain-containing protein [Halobacteriovoraceae bacterium]MCB9095311.1 putative Ig domain-containing protein [Halobacteriovoraceae bacterium]